MRRIVCCVLTLASSAVHASPAGADGDDPVEPNRPVGDPNGYAAAGGIFGQDDFSFHGIAGEAGMRIGRSPIFGRVMAAGGNLELARDPGHGTYAEGRVGGELRACRDQGLVCASVGLDLGYHHAQYTHLDLSQPAFKRSEGDPLVESIDSTLLAPRLTIDGGGRVRVRGVLEAPHYMRAGQSVAGVAASLTLGVAF